MNGAPEQADGGDAHSGNAIVQVVETTRKGQKKSILWPMAIDFPAGKVTAILGPSGCGKTTVLDFITGSISGGITARGEVNLPGTNAYVPQGDCLHGFYTVEAYMNHYTRLSGEVVDDSSKVHIQDILACLGMTKHKDTIVGDVFLSGLSGGQKRRLSVALEALSNPVNFFLDEPTSGLDSESAYQVMNFLKEYVRASPGRRVILTIHQPSSLIWQLIDNVVLLSRGKLIYQGPRLKMETFFDANGCPTPPQYNPADHYVTIVNDDFMFQEKDPDAWSRAFTEWSTLQGSTLSQSTMTQSVCETVGTYGHIETNRADFATSVRVLTKRYFTNLILNPGILGTRVAMYIMLSIVIGILFWDLGDSSTYPSIQSRIALTFYCVAFFIFMSIAVMPFAVMEREIVEKEVRNGYYHPCIYQIAQAFASIPGAALLAFLTTVIICGMTGLRSPFWYFLNMFLALICAEALAQLVSHIVPHFIIGMALVAGFYGLFMLLQGFMLVPSEFPGWLRWSHSIAFHTYSWRTFMYTEFHDQTYPDAQPPEFRDGNNVLAIYEIEDVNRGLDMITLIGYAGALHACSFFVLYIKHKMAKRVNALTTKID